MVIGLNTKCGNLLVSLVNNSRAYYTSVYDAINNYSNYYSQQRIWTPYNNISQYLSGGNNYENRQQSYPQINYQEIYNSIFGMYTPPGQQGNDLVLKDPTVPGKKNNTGKTNNNGGKTTTPSKTQKPAPVTNPQEVTPPAQDGQVSATNIPGYSKKDGLRIAKQAREHVKDYVKIPGKATPCARFVRQDMEALGIPWERRNSAADLVEPLSKNPNFVEVPASSFKDPKDIPPGAVIVYQRGDGGYSAKHGHVEISLGDGNAAHFSICKIKMTEKMRIFIPVNLNLKD